MANEKWLIDANALVEFIKANYCQYCNSYGGLLCGACSNDTFMCHVETAPTVDAVEVVHGEWSTIEDDYCGLTALKCSECNQEYWFEEEPPTKIYNYCPNCGAKMDRGG